MSNREKIIALLDGVPEYKMGYVLAYVQGLTADEDADDAFCQQMYERYQNDPEKDVEFTLAGTGRSSCWRDAASSQPQTS